MDRVKAKIAIITGAASMPGLGNTTAKLLAREGAAVVVTDIDFVGAEKCAAEIVSAGGRAIALFHDVTKEESWQQILAESQRKFGQIDILVNNAGILDLTYSIEDMTLENWNVQIEINMTGVFLGCKHVIPYMRKAGGGSIINLSSVGGLVGVGNGAYGATKAGVRLLSKSIGVRYGCENIRCNSVHPGIMRTNLTEKYLKGSPDAAQRLIADIPAGRLGEPEDIANCVLFLASDESRFVTGAELVVDGGQTAH